MVGTEHLIVGAQHELAEAQAEIARLQKALTAIAAIEYMGPYVGERVNAIIEGSKPWSPTGIWPDWGDSPRGFDGPGGAE
jgi:hypothetical protein